MHGYLARDYPRQNSQSQSGGSGSLQELHQDQGNEAQEIEDEDGKFALEA